MAESSLLYTLGNRAINLLSLQRKLIQCCTTQCPWIDSMVGSLVVVPKETKWGFSFLTFVSLCFATSFCGLVWIRNVALVSLQFLRRIVMIDHRQCSVTCMYDSSSYQHELSLSSLKLMCMNS